MYYTFIVSNCVLERMEKMIYKEMSCAAIHDISGVGKCSLTVALPVLSACGVETSVMPTAVLSTHTGGFTGFTYTDLTEDLLPMAEHWRRVGCTFDALYTGFLGSVHQIDLIDQIFTMFQTEKNLIIMDPVMGDNGKLYPTYTDEMADGVARLSRRADILVPNMTEASRILGIDYQEGPYTREFVEDVLRSLCALGPKKAVLTGVWLEEGKLGSACRDAQAEKTEFFMQERVPGYYHGTGDLFASVLTGAVLNGMDIFQATAVATEFTWMTIVTTREKSKDVKFGPKFEIHLPWLAAFMENHRKSLQDSGK